MHAFEVFSHAIAAEELKKVYINTQEVMHLIHWQKSMKSKYIMM
jgi:hypothetical protein